MVFSKVRFVLSGAAFSWVVMASRSAWVSAAPITAASCSPVGASGMVKMLATIVVVVACKTSGVVSTGGTVVLVDSGAVSGGVVAVTLGVGKGLFGGCDGTETVVVVCGSVVCGRVVAGGTLVGGSGSVVVESTL
jgi:hypothetical protein